MSRWTTPLALLSCAVCATIACSKSGVSRASAATAAAVGTSASTRADTTAGPDCRKVLSPDDVAGLMKAPVTVSRAPGGTAWCGFTNDFSGDITMMIGSSENTEIFWHGAHIPDDKSTVVPLPGVGDDAVYTQNARGEIPEVAVKKGRVYCIVTYDAGTVDKYKMFKGAGGADLAKRLGALCTKSFAVFGA